MTSILCGIHDTINKKLEHIYKTSVDSMRTINLNIFDWTTSNWDTRHERTTIDQLIYSRLPSSRVYRNQCKFYFQNCINQCSKWLKINLYSCALRGAWPADSNKSNSNQILSNYVRKIFKWLIELVARKKAWQHCFNKTLISSNWHLTYFIQIK